MNDPKRQEIKERIAASQQRHGTRGVGATSSRTEDQRGVVGFATDHPILTVASGLAVGVLIAGLFPSARSAARNGGKRASKLGAAGTTAAFSLFQHLIDSAGDASRAGGETLSDLGSTIGQTARGATRDVRHVADQSSETARIAARDAGKAFSRSLNKLWR